MTAVSGSCDIYTERSAACRMAHRADDASMLSSPRRWAPVAYWLLSKVDDYDIIILAAASLMIRWYDDVWLFSFCLPDEHAHTPPLIDITPWWRCNVARHFLGDFIWISAFRYRDWLCFHARNATIILICKAKRSRCCWVSEVEFKFVAVAIDIIRAWEYSAVRHRSRKSVLSILGIRRPRLLRAA